ncbi:hypothetical protein RB597_003150 [Gaeumannomyces tritici]
MLESATLRHKAWGPLLSDVPRRPKADDGVTGGAVSLICIATGDKNGSNVDLSQTETDRLSDAEKDQLILGSKYLQVTWYTYTGFLWCMKACLLFFYDRLKFNLWTYDWVFKALCWATFLSYVTVVQPLPSPECLFQGQNLIVSVVLNILTDAAILSLPLPVLQDLRTPPLKKALVALLICSGFFVISAAAVRLTATLDAAPSAVTINRWGIRECEIGLVAINTPVLRPLFTRKFWARRSSDSRIGGEGDRGAGGAAAHHHHHRGWGRGCCFFGVTLDSLAAPARTNGRGGGGGGGGTWTVGHLPQHARTDAAGAAHEQPPCGRQQRGWRRAACPGQATRLAPSLGRAPVAYMQ